MICYKDMQLMMSFISMGGVGIFFCGFFLPNVFILIFGIIFTLASVFFAVGAGIRAKQIENCSSTSGEKRS